MNLIEALKEANGKPIARKAWPDKRVFYQVVKGILTLSGEVSNECFRLFECHFLADDWYVVEPNPIEAEIENVADKLFLTDEAKKRLRHIANFALEQAIAIEEVARENAWGYEECIEHIKLLKVKE